MRFFFAFLVLLLLPWTAKAQALDDLYYWFDNDPVPKQTGKISGPTIQIQPDVSHLETGFHTLYVLAVDTTGAHSNLIGRMFFKTPKSNSIFDLLYTIDSERVPQKMRFIDGNVSLDVSKYKTGMHFINYYSVDENGDMTNAGNACFYRSPMESDHKISYWFDGDTVATEVRSFKDGFIVDVTRIKEGLNTIHFQIDENTNSVFQSEYFIKIPQIENTGDMSLICIIDGKIVGHEKITAHEGIIKCDMDVSNMDIGLHKAMFQLVTASGIGSTIAETYFIRTMTNEDVTSMKCSYTIDGIHHRTFDGICTNGVIHFDLPVEDIEYGIHRIDYRFVAKNEVSSTQGSAWFYKSAVGDVGIRQYEYWLNDNNDKVHSITLDVPKDPFQLIKLLPVAPEPIRSECFHFEIKNGKPTMYAKNDIHFRFHDVTGRWVDEERQYVDYNVSSNVTDIVKLTSNQTFERLDDNAIKWFIFDAEEGDSLRFKVNQPSAIQLFSPSGKELYSAMEDKSVVWDGCHTWEDGTHYLAVHNTTGSKEFVTLDFNHLARYDIVSQDVDVVGNGGISSITIKGNGFTDLYDVELSVKTKDGTNVLHPLDINHVSDAEAILTFDFSKVELVKPSNDGELASEDLRQNDNIEGTTASATFHFTEKDKIVDNFILVEEEKPIELITKVTSPSSFMRSVTYTCEITNKGNMTAYAVPVYIWMKSKSEKGIFNIKLEGFNLPRLSECVSDEVLTESEVEELKLGLEKLSDDYHFMKFWTEDEDNLGDSVCVRSNYFYTNIAPNSTKTIRLTISSNEDDVFAYFTLPEEWPSYYTISDSTTTLANARFPNLKSQNAYCCYRDRVECVANIICNGLDIASMFSVSAPIGIASCVAGSINQVISAVGDTYCGKNDVKGDFIKKVNKIVKGINVTAAITSCASAFGVKNLNEIVLALDAITHPFAVVDCITSFTTKKPGCPPTPPQGGRTPIMTSYDPNDIYGYLSPTGTLHIADSIKNVNYRIEFENDTAFATASAHVVEIKDTLDRRFFDLDTFSPTSIKIGNKVEYLDGNPNFVKTIDMRPSINTIAQVEGKYDTNRGIATWTFTSLDPMTMEPTDDISQGFLPVNYDGESGTGEVSFEISLKSNLTNDTKIPNRASIVFDINEPILTPTWTNIMDVVAPVSQVTHTDQKNDSILTIYFTGDDESSDIWKYDVYVQYGYGASWQKVTECKADSNYIDFRFYDGIDYGFCVLATDSAGNVEKKELIREGEFAKVNLGDVNCDGEINTLDASLTTAYYLEQPVYILAMAADVNGDDEINTLDATQITQMYLNANITSRIASISTRQRLKLRRSTK